MCILASRPIGPWGSLTSSYFLDPASGEKKVGTERNDQSKTRGYIEPGETVSRVDGLNIFEVESYAQLRGREIELLPIVEISALTGACIQHEKRVYIGGLPEI